MPELDGFQVVGAIRERERATGQHLPVIALTARSRKEDRERCLAAGMDDYLAKPLRPDELSRVLGHWVTGDAAPPAAAPAAPLALEALIDDARMAVFRKDYADIAGQLAELFVTTTPPLLEELRAAHDGGGAEALCRAAHKLKGSCLNIGATFMATLAGSIEGDGAASADAVAGLEAAYEPTSQALRRALGA